MKELIGNQAIAPEDQLVVIIEGTGLSGKTTVSKALGAYGFSEIGRGHHLRGITSLYLEQKPDQIEAFDPDCLPVFLEEEAKAVYSVMMGRYEPMHDRRSPLINTFVPKVAAVEAAQDVINGFTFDELNLMSNRGIERVVVEGRALPEIFTEATEAGKFAGQVIGNFHLTVSDEVAGDRAQAKADQDDDCDFDRKAAIERLQIRNTADRNREHHPMVLSPNAFRIDRPGFIERASVIGAAALFDADFYGIPRCVNLHTDLLTQEAVQQTVGGLIEGALLGRTIEKLQAPSLQMV